MGFQAKFLEYGQPSDYETNIDALAIVYSAEFGALFVKEFGYKVVYRKFLNKSGKLLACRKKQETTTSMITN